MFQFSGLFRHCHNVFKLQYLNTEVVSGDMKWILRQADIQFADADFLNGLRQAYYLYFGIIMLSK